jgi:outer membrane immunogenic protein
MLAADWTGLYGGTFVAGALGSYSVTGTGSAHRTALGGATGVLAGYNWRAGALVYGLEGDLGSNYLIGKIPGAPGLVANETESIYALHARLRLGYDAGEFMPFIAGGPAYVRTAQYQQPPLDFDGQSQMRLGWTLGAGVEAKVVIPIIGPSVLRAEYLYEGLPTTSYDLNGPVLHTEMTTHYLRLALISTIDPNWRAAPDIDPADWAGSYLGVIGGAANQRITTKGMGLADAFSASGALGGVYSGQNWMFGHAMLGVDGAATLANITGRGAQPGAASTDYQGFVESDLRGRAGYAMGRFLPFVASGIVFGASQQVDEATGGVKVNQPVLAGTIGAGLDYMASERIAIRAEYLYSRSLAGEATHLDNDYCCSQTRASNIVRVGAAYFFH